jgi:integrase
VLFRDWCVANNCAPLPATPETVVAFVDAMGQARAPATIGRYLWSLGLLHQAAGLPDPTNDLKVRHALKRLRRAKGRRQRQATPLNWSAVRDMLSAKPASLQALRDRALMLTAYDTLVRRAELVSLRVEDLHRDRSRKDRHATLLLRRAKGDQEGEGAELYLAPDTAAAIAAWVEAAGISQGRLFRRIDRHGHVAGVVWAGNRAVDTGGPGLDAGSVNRILKRVARSVGADDSISGHSARVGAAQDMMAHGIELLPIQQAGRWKTVRMPARYTERIAAGRGGMAQLVQRQRAEGER